MKDSVLDFAVAGHLPDLESRMKIIHGQSTGIGAAERTSSHLPF